MSRARTVRRFVHLSALVGLVVLMGLPALPAGAAPEPTTTTTAGPTTTTAPSTTTTTTAPPPTTTAPATTPPTPPPNAVASGPAIALTGTVTATPSTGLGYKQEIEIHGSGFSPSTQLGFAECESGTSGAEGCDLSTVGF